MSDADKIAKFSDFAARSVAPIELEPMHLVFFVNYAVQRAGRDFLNGSTIAFHTIDNDNVVIIAMEDFSIPQFKQKYDIKE